jgi:spermidine synthase
MDESVIYRSIGDDGVIEITQEGSIRSLNFGNDAKQSSMDQDRPERLVLSYTRTMMASLLFQPAAESILLIGLGGGSIAKFLLHHLPDAMIEVIEVRADVVKLAHGYFNLPEHPRLKIHIDDAEHFLSNERSGNRRYDLILIDAFDHDGVSSDIMKNGFFDSCSSLLNNNGVIAINLWSSHSEEYSRLLDTLESMFNRNTLILPVIDRGNIIVFATKDKRGFDFTGCKTKARQLEQEMELEFPSLLRRLKRHNRLRRLFL